jgi:MFS family permease
MDGYERRWVMLPVVLAAAFMYGFDANVVNIALPSLQRDLHAGPLALELVVGGYIFAYAAGLVSGGRLGDQYGYRRLFLVGVTAFTAASLLCGLAQDPAELVAARMLQGLTAAAMVPQVLALITSGFPAGERAGALAWFGVSAGLSGVFGQLLGGVLLSADVFGLGWRVAFLLNVPVGVLVVAAARRVLPPPAAAPAPRALDPVGLITVSLGVALALVPLALGRSQGWPAWIWTMFGLSVPWLLLALGYERRLGRRGGDPLLDLSLFRVPTFRVGVAIAAVFMAYFASSIFVLSLLLQDGLGLSPLQAGLVFTPMAITGIASSFIGRRLVTSYGAPGAILAGCAATGAGLVLLEVVLRLCHGHSAGIWIAAAAALLGPGTIVLSAYLGATLSQVRPDQAGIASGTLNTIQQFAGSAGLVIVTAVFFAALGPAGHVSAYPAATEAALWIELGLVSIIAGLAVALSRGQARTPNPSAGTPPLADGRRLPV